MSSPGEIVKDILPIPDNIDLVTDPNKDEVSHSLADEPTMSHALAMADHDEKGHAQEPHDKEVQNLGWNESDDKIPDPLVGGLSNDDLWILIRRFNKVRISHERLTGRKVGSPCLELDPGSQQSA